MHVIIATPFVALKKYASEPAENSRTYNLDEITSLAALIADAVEGFDAANTDTSDSLRATLRAELASRELLTHGG